MIAKAAPERAIRAAFTSRSLVVIRIGGHEAGRVRIQGCHRPRRQPLLPREQTGPARRPGEAFSNFSNERRLARRAD